MLIFLFRIGVVSAGVAPVDGKVGMVPVDERIVQTDVQAFVAEGVGVFFYDVLSVGGVGRFIVGVGGIEQTEAFVVFSGEHSVFHSGRLCAFRPLAGVEEVGVEQPEIFIVFFVADLFVGFYPFVAGGHGIQAEMNEHTEAVVREPCGVPRGFSGNIT